MDDHSNEISQLLDKEDHWLMTECTNPVQPVPPFSIAARCSDPKTVWIEDANGNTFCFVAQAIDEIMNGFSAEKMEAFLAGVSTKIFFGPTTT